MHRSAVCGIRFAGEMKYFKFPILLLAGFLFLAPLHFAVETHRWCPEHNTYEHGESSDFISTSSPESTKVYLPLTPEENGHHHDSCQIIQLIQRISVVTPSTGYTSRDIVSACGQHLIQDRVFLTLLPIATAPKTSPPAVVVC